MLKRAPGRSDISQWWKDLVGNVCRCRSATLSAIYHYLIITCLIVSSCAQYDRGFAAALDWVIFAYMLHGYFRARLRAQPYRIPPLSSTNKVCWAA